MKSTQFIFILLLSTMMVDKIYCRQIEDEYYYDDDIDFDDLDDLDDEDYPDEDIEENISRFGNRVYMREKKKEKNKECNKECSIKGGKLTEEQQICWRECYNAGHYGESRS